MRILICICPLLALSCLQNDVQDARCTPDAPDKTISEACPYRSNGPQPELGTCETEFHAAQSGAGWQDVFTIFVDNNRGMCSNAACHGDQPSAANGIYLPANDERIFYETLTNTFGSIGKKYVNPDNPLDSWIHCNTAGTHGGGFYMPKPGGLQSRSDAQIIEDWIHNGAEGPL